MIRGYLLDDKADHNRNTTSFRDGLLFYLELFSSYRGMEWNYTYVKVEDRVNGDKSASKHVVELTQK